MLNMKKGQMLMQNQTIMITMNDEKGQVDQRVILEIIQRTLNEELNMFELKERKIF